MDEELLTDDEPVAVNGHGRYVARQTPYMVKDDIPKAMNGLELARVLNMSPAKLYALQRAGKLKRFEFRNPVSPQRIFSGALVTRYLEQGL